MGVFSLFQIAQNVCIKQASCIADVGDTPYHLIQPILKRLNAKQLAIVEENSPVVTPYSDELWLFLIEKDFPDRPLNVNKLSHVPSVGNAHMPNRALYRHYLLEKEKFLATSADRLRKMTEKLRKEKSKNSITKVQGVIADPTIRRRAAYNYTSRSFNSRGFNSVKPKPKSILGKAIRDVSHRSLMFGGPVKSYDPFMPFQNQRPRVPPPKRPETQHRERNPLSAQGPVSSNGYGSAGNVANATVPVDSRERSNRTRESSSAGPESPTKLHTGLEQTSSSVVDHTVSEAPSQPLRKRRPPPSIFLNSRKKPRHSTPSPAPKKPNPKAKVEVEDSSSGKPIKAIKSSIFN